MEFRVSTVALDIGIEDCFCVMQHVHIRGGEPEMDSFKSGNDLIRAAYRNDETNQAILTGVAGLQGHLARAYRPSLLRTELSLIRAVVRDIGVITGTGSFVLRRVPESSGPD